MQNVSSWGQTCAAAQCTPGLSATGAWQCSHMDSARPEGTLSALSRCWGSVPLTLHRHQYVVAVLPSIQLFIDCIDGLSLAVKQEPASACVLQPFEDGCGVLGSSCRVTCGAALDRWQEIDLQLSYLQGEHTAFPCRPSCHIIVPGNARSSLLNLTEMWSSFKLCRCHSVASSSLA